ncbi:hypothetical protein C7999DRAFT_34104 [Corynascus novoguineensis]|uniref:Uncharacterized protein n=1 Tax=Corynascus novoguineensis TaxID=1126955 RepID=A0AAN7CNT8_9PEZI|nr:hypothetical protein C7999DRAFT_34104 [Corynascus novoguineensis]
MPVPNASPNANPGPKDIAQPPPSEAPELLPDDGREEPEAEDEEHPDEVKTSASPNERPETSGAEEITAEDEGEEDEDEDEGES